MCAVRLVLVLACAGVGMCWCWCVLVLVCAGVGVCWCWRVLVLACAGMSVCWDVSAGVGVGVCWDVGTGVTFHSPEQRDCHSIQGGKDKENTYLFHRHAIKSAHYLERPRLSKYWIPHDTKPITT